ncbi:hypothetical protein CC86DRAFT_105519 [Ophiobolus disseminans]|uniref:Uncharacterized protein n=1 Tax=Ophiobolus disseminans TaxID=1469910 RepID=A0A6A6ZMR2_9PLEO|nr:hypothetical protein CC86DRAFT_105519 [Ophiobolus disseminans]
MLSRIPYLLNTNLSDSAGLQRSDTTDLVPAADKYIEHLRLVDGCTEKFPYDSEVDRKARRPRRKYNKCYLSITGTAYEVHVREVMAHMFNAWTPEQTAVQ